MERRLVGGCCRAIFRRRVRWLSVEARPLHIRGQVRRASHSVSKDEINNEEEEERADQEAAVVEEFQGERGDAGEVSLRTKQKLQNQPHAAHDFARSPWSV
jgi:hypothetical protein